MWGAYGRVPARTSVSFVSPAALEAGLADRLSLSRALVPVGDVSVCGKAAMVNNDALPDITVDPDTFTVRIDGEVVEAAPAPRAASALPGNLPTAQSTHSCGGNCAIGILVDRLTGRMRECRGTAPVRRAVPAGGHAHSGGLEPAVTAGAVTDLTCLEVFLRGRLRTAGMVAAGLATAACARVRMAGDGECSGATVSRSGSSTAHSSRRSAHRGSKGHPGGGAAGSGTSPPSVGSAFPRAEDSDSRDLVSAML
jgi:hypothetical protein